MKCLQRILALFLLSCVVFSCQKEYSVETNTGSSNPDAQWSFTEGSLQFKGPVDTASIDTIGGLAALFVNGHSDDKRDIFNLEFYGQTLKVGTYKTPYCLFAYARNGVLLYQTNQTLIDSFTIVVTKLDATGVTGTFSGKAYDTTKTNKTIVNGRFSALFKTTTPPIPTDSGQVLFWSKAGCGGGTSTTPINVTINGKAGKITKFFPATAPASCDSANGFGVKLPIGSYPFVAKCSSDSIKGTVTVTKNGCTLIQVDFTGASTGDYFPMTKNSNWSYKELNGTAADTTYTLSLGTFKNFGGQTYNIFTDKTGSSKDSSYYRKSGDLYYQYIPALTYKDSSTGSVITLTTQAYEVHFLSENLAANAVFLNGPFNATASQAPLPAFPITINVKSTVLAVGASSPPYSNIIKIKNVYSYTVGGVSSDAYATEQWFSKGIGLIKEVQYNTKPFTAPTKTVDITRASVF